MEGDRGRARPAVAPCPGHQRRHRAAVSPEVSHVAHNGYLRYPDTPEGIHASLYGIESRYRDGRARVYALDLGTGLIVLASDFWRDDPDAPEQAA